MIHARGLALIKRFEGFRSEAYRDPVGVLTIGYGHTKTVKEGDTITEEDAADLLSDEVEEFRQGVMVLCTRLPTATELAAMTSLAYNIGLAGFARSTVLRKHNKGDHTGAANAFAMWNKGRVNGELTVLPGLVKRRAAEAELYLGGENTEVSVPAESAQKPIGKSRTIIGAAIAGTSGIGPMLQQAGVEIQSLGIEWLGYVGTVLLLGGIGLVIYARVDDWREGRL